MQRRIITFLLILFLLLGESEKCVFASSGSNEHMNAGELLNYLLSTIGAVSSTVVEGAIYQVEKIDTKLRSLLLDEIEGNISQSDGLGIYEDENNNIHFSNEFTQNFYNIINNYQGESNINASEYMYLINYNEYNSLINSPYVNTQYGDMIEVYLQGIEGKYYVIEYGYEDSTTIYTIALIINNTSSQDDLYFNYKNGNTIRVTTKNIFNNNNNGTAYYKYARIQCVYDKNNNTYRTTQSVNNSNSNTYMSCPSYTTINNWYGWNNFINDGYKGFYSNSFFFVCKNDYALNNWLNGNITDSGGNTKTIKYINNYDTFKTVNKNVINNNNWENIYNTYVNDVSTEVNNEIQSGNDVSLESLTEIMGTYVNAIINAINSGNGENIENEIEVSNGWLRRIYRRLGIIYDLLNAWRSDSSGILGGGSGGSGNGTDLTEVINDLEAIKRNLFNIQSSVNSSGVYLLDILDNENEMIVLMEEQYNVTWEIYNALVSMMSKSDGTTTNIYYTTNNYNNMTNRQKTELNNKGDTIGNLLKESFPLAFVFGFGSVVTMLAREPTRPEWHIPFKSTFFNIDETVDIEISESFDGAAVVLRALIDLAFIVFLVMVSFKVIEFVSKII